MSKTVRHKFLHMLAAHLFALTLLSSVLASPVAAGDCPTNQTTICG